MLMESSRASFFYIWIRTCFRMVVDWTFEIFTAKTGNVSHSEMKNLFKLTKKKYRQSQTKYLFSAEVD